MQNTLILLSPFATPLLMPEAGAKIAMDLHARGVKRADLATLPQYGYGAHTRPHKGYAAPDFTAIAENMAKTVIRPVIGHSDVCDLSHLPRVKTPPDLQSLARVGALFARAADIPGSPDMDRSDGRALGLIFHLALYARAADGEMYDALLFPTLSARARQGLHSRIYLRSPGDCDLYGRAVALDTLREAARGLVSTQRTFNDAPPPPAYPSVMFC
ncbi:MAG: hypothetical protein H6865_07015 [Rhodospirillales bacterium]|nr:hypothetical protein [Alphaproteobacteria bacterium]MCB9987367.1 hypothetical protein [Rhodospirillales bacterium]USO07785.1 MAG: hypothetical protein H6866_00690 [Rhodospirillales bacterium]